MPLHSEPRPADERLKLDAATGTHGVRPQYQAKRIPSLVRLRSRRLFGPGAAAVVHAQIRYGKQSSAILFSVKLPGAVGFELGVRGHEGREMENVPPWGSSATRPSPFTANVAWLCRAE